MLEVGHEFERNGVLYCVIDIVDFNRKSYCFLSEERKNQKLNFHFYEYNIKANGDVSLNVVKDDTLLGYLYGLMEERQ